MFEWRRREKTRRRTTELENKLCDVIERFNATRDVITPRQFLDNISLVYLDSYYHEKMSRRNASLKLLSLSKEQLESIVAVMNDQNKYGQLDGTTNVVESVDRNKKLNCFATRWSTWQWASSIIATSSQFQAFVKAVESASLWTMLYPAFADQSGGRVCLKASGR